MSEEPIENIFDSDYRREIEENHTHLLVSFVEWAKTESEEDFVCGAGWANLELFIGLHGHKIGKFFYEVLRRWSPSKTELKKLSKEICRQNRYFYSYEGDKAGAFVSHIINLGLIGNTQEELKAISDHHVNFKLMEFICEKCGKVPLVILPDDLTNPCESGGHHSFVVKDPGSMVQYVVGQKFSREMMMEQGKQFG